MVSDYHSIVMKIISGFGDTLKSLQEPHTPPDSIGGETCSKHTKPPSCSQMCLDHWGGDKVSVLDEVIFFLMPLALCVSYHGPRCTHWWMITTLLLI